MELRGDYNSWMPRVTEEGYTISLKCQCINGLHQLSIPRQRGDRRGRVALHQVRHLGLPGGEAPSDARIPNIDAGFQVLPKPLDRGQRRAGRGQPHEDDVVWYGHALGHVRRGVVQQADVQPLCLGLATRGQQETQARGVQAGPCPPEGFACGGLPSGREPGRLLARLADLDRLHAVAGEATGQGPVPASTTVLLTAPPHGVGGRLSPSGGDGPEAARARCDKVRRLRHFFFAGLGRGRLSWALSG